MSNMATRGPNNEKNVKIKASGDISKMPHFLDTILFRNIKPLSITRVSSKLQKILLVSILPFNIFGAKMRFSSGGGQGSPAMYL